MADVLIAEAEITKIGKLLRDNYRGAKPLYYIPQDSRLSFYREDMRGAEFIGYLTLKDSFQDIKRRIQLHFNLGGCNCYFINPAKPNLLIRARSVVDLAEDLSSWFMKSLDKAKIYATLDGSLYIFPTERISPKYKHIFDTAVPLEYNTIIKTIRRLFSDNYNVCLKYDFDLSELPMEE